VGRQESSLFLQIQARVAALHFGLSGCLEKQRTRLHASCPCHASLGSSSTAQASISQASSCRPGLLYSPHCRSSACTICFGGALPPSLLRACLACSERGARASTYARIVTRTARQSASAALGCDQIWRPAFDTALRTQASRPALLVELQQLLLEPPARDRLAAVLLRGGLQHLRLQPLAARRRPRLVSARPRARGSDCRDASSCGAL